MDHAEMLRKAIYGGPTRREVERQKKQDELAVCRVRRSEEGQNSQILGYGFVVKNLQITPGYYHRFCLISSDKVFPNDDFNIESYYLEFKKLTSNKLKAVQLRDIVVKSTNICQISGLVVIPISPSEKCRAKESIFEYRPFEVVKEGRQPDVMLRCYLLNESGTAKLFDVKQRKQQQQKWQTMKQSDVPGQYNLPEVDETDVTCEWDLAVILKHSYDKFSVLGALTFKDDEHKKISPVFFDKPLFSDISAAEGSLRRDLPCSSDRPDAEQSRIADISAAEGSSSRESPCSSDRPDTEQSRVADISASEGSSRRESPCSSDCPDAEQSRIAVNTSPKASSEGAIKTETGSMDQIESASHFKSEGRMKVDLSHDRLETVSGTSSCAESESFQVLPSIEGKPGKQTSKYEISERGGVWKLQDIQAAAFITFPQNAVTKPVLFKCTLRKLTTNFPPLKKDEALVSSVIVLTCDDPLSFNEEVTVALSHSATNLKGYEVVIRELVDTDNNEWEDLETTNISQASADIQSDPSSKPRIPFAEAKVTRCSAFAVICRLKSYKYSTNAQGEWDFICKVQDYPDVSVTIPASVIREKRDFLLTLKVQEIPRQWLNDSETIIALLLHITCSPAIQLREPATITMPISMQADQIVSRQLSSKNVRVLVNTDEKTSDWKEITDQLPRPADLTNGVVTFQATHFSWYTALLGKILSLDMYRRVPLEAGFFACLCRSNTPGESQLRFCCYPDNLEAQVRTDICSRYEVLLYGNGSSKEQLCQDEVILVKLRDGLKPRKNTSEDDLQLRFLSDKKCENDVVVLDPCGGVPVIEFLKHLDEKPPRNKKLCSLSIIPPPAQTSNKQMRIVTDDDLNKLSESLGDKWNKLGRRLGFKEPKLTAFDKDKAGLVDKAYSMLMSWKEREGSKATYQVLYNALTNPLVGLKLYAEEICCNKL